jgi:hypothetical protein
MRRGVDEVFLSTPDFIIGCHSHISEIYFGTKRNKERKLQIPQRGRKAPEAVLDCRRADAGKVGRQKEG